jgi:hypothetical protein
MHGGTEGRRKVVGVRHGEEFSMSGSAEHDFDTSGATVADEPDDGIGDVVHSRRNAADGRFGLGTK